MKPTQKDLLLALGLMLVIVLVGFVVSVPDSVPEPITHQGGMMPEAEKTFGTPIEWVRFSWENGQDQTIENVVSRTIYGEGANMLVVARDTQGAFVAVRGWVQMEQSPAASFF